MPRIQNDCINTIEIKKSKFITYLHRTQDEQEAKDFLKAIKKEHPNANHHCTAMIIGNIMRWRTKSDSRSPYVRCVDA